MDAFVQPLYELADFDAIIRQLKKPGIVQVSGCLDSQKAHFTNGLLREFPFRLIVAENDLKAKAFYEDFRLYDPEVLYYPARDLIFKIGISMVIFLPDNGSRCFAHCWSGKK